MNVGSLLAELGFTAMKAEVLRRANRLTRRVVVAALTGLLLAMAVGFAVAALTVWLAGEVGTFWALTILAAVLLVLAGMVQGIARITSSRRPTWRPTPRSPITEAFVTPDREPPPGSALVLVAVVAVVGLLLVRQILRR
jgi:hypothetical protein